MRGVRPAAAATGGVTQHESNQFILRTCQRKGLPVHAWDEFHQTIEDAQDAQYAMAALHTTPRGDMPRTRATEICGMLCPECCMIEARPGCCIYPRGHRDNHYCGKCGNTDKR